MSLTYFKDGIDILVLNVPVFFGLDISNNFENAIYGLVLMYWNLGILDSCPGFLTICLYDLGQDFYFSGHQFLYKLNEF